MLEKEKQIDAVVVATPVTYMPFPTMMAVKLGKHVYCEKPLTHSVWRHGRSAKRARAHKVATQMGNQGQASEGARRLFRNGAGGCDRPESLKRTFGPTGPP